MGCSDKIIEKHKGDLAQRDIQRFNKKKIRKKRMGHSQKGQAKKSRIKYDYSVSGM